MGSPKLGGHGLSVSPTDEGGQREGNHHAVDVVVIEIGGDRGAYVRDRSCHIGWCSILRRCGGRRQYAHGCCCARQEVSPLHFRSSKWQLVRYRCRYCLPDLLN